MFFVLKKDGKLRMVVDYQAVNKATIPDVYPLPLIQQTINELGSSVYYSTFDLPGAYQLLRVLKQYVKNTAFCTQYGMFKSTVVRDGLRNAPAVFQHCVKTMPVPHDLRSSRAFIGFVAYYCHFIANFSKLALPITDLMKKNVPFVWGPAQQGAFETLRDLLVTAPILAHYNPKLPTTIQTDALHFGWGAIISHRSEEDGLDRPIFIESGKFKDAKLRYNTTEKEFLAIVNAFT